MKKSILPYLCLVPLALSACSKSNPTSATTSNTAQVSSDPGFNASYQDWMAARDALKEKRCHERRCFVPGYPLNKALLEEIKAGHEKAAAVYDNPAPSNVGAWVRKEARAWDNAMMETAAQIEASVATTEAKLAEVEPKVAPARQNLQSVTNDAAADGCTLPADGPVIACAGLSLPLDDVNEARRLVRELETAKKFSAAYQQVVDAFSEIPDMEEARQARAKVESLNRYVTLMTGSFGEQIRTLVKARWQAAVDEFAKVGIPADLPENLDTNYQGEPSDRMLDQAQEEVDGVTSLVSTIQRRGPEFAAHAIDRIRFVSGLSSGYSSDAFDYAPVNKSSLTVNLSTRPWIIEISALLLTVPAKTDSRYVQRASLLAEWDVARRKLPPQEANGTLIPVTIQVGQDYLDELLEKMKLVDAIGTLQTIADARAIFSAKLDEALRASGKALRGGERLVICDYSSCGLNQPRGTYVLQLNDQNPRLDEGRLANAAQKIVGRL